ncbi:MAG: GNAT family N-acetyltransferase, partial [Clostridia bacterium]|nr:GNAT family N-acetyltransferase [Clostridia bacterium]
MEHVEITPLPKEKWKGVPIPLTVRSESFYDVEIAPLDGEGGRVSFVRKKAEKEIVHTPDEYDFPDSLYQPHWEKAEAYGVVGDGG